MFLKSHLVLLLSISICNCTPIPRGDITANDRIGTSGFSSLFTSNQENPILGTPVRVTKKPGYYPDFKQYGREEAVLEGEHWISKIDSVYNRAQKTAADYLNLKPLVDTIEEHEKYGNDGEQHRGVAKALVNGFDVIGKKINNVVDFPFEAKRYASKGLIAALDAVGAKLVGI